MSLQGDRNTSFFTQLMWYSCWLYWWSVDSGQSVTFYCNYIKIQFLLLLQFTQDIVCRWNSDLPVVLQILKCLDILSSDVGNTTFSHKMASNQIKEFLLNQILTSRKKSSFVVVVYRRTVFWPIISQVLADSGLSEQGFDLLLLRRLHVWRTIRGRSWLGRALKTRCMTTMAW